METEEILRSVFEPDIVSETASSNFKSKEGSANSKQSLGLTVVDKYIEVALLNESHSPSTEDTPVGRIGPKLVRFDVSSHHGLFVVSPDRLSLNSQSNFNTMRANTAVYKGKWMYELQLGSKGVMQVGWGTMKCKFNEESGVGDTVNSYAYDGNRVRKWNVSTYKYGEPWLSGDIIGCTLDMDNGTVEFYRNGRSLGKAFENITMGSGIAYFPTVSLAFTENLTANFGSTPFRYPVEGYRALQAIPREQVNKSLLLFKWFSNLIYIATDDSQDVIMMENRIMSDKAFLVCLARLILKNLGPLLAMPYIAEAVFVPFVEELAGLADKNQSSHARRKPVKLLACMDFLWTFLEEHEMKTCLESTIVHLLSAFRHVSLLLEYPDQCRSLALLTSLCRHTATRQHLLRYVLFDRVRFANFVHVKPLDEGGLISVVNKTWWETNPVDSAIEVNKEQYIRSCERIKTAISEVEALQVELLVTLLDNSDGTSHTPTSRTIFLKKFRRFVQENLITSRITSIPQTPLPITLCCFHRLLTAFRVLWDTEIQSSPIYIPCRSFYDASINYAGIDRLGGVISHLNKTFKTELIHLLGPDHEVIIAMDDTQAPNSQFSGGLSRLAELPIVIPAFARMINVNASGSTGPMVFGRLGYFPESREDRSPLPNGARDSAISLLELLDGIILFYYAAAKRQIAKVASLRDSMNEYVMAIADMKTWLKLVKKRTDSDSQLIRQELEQTIEVFDTKLSEQARHMAWVRAAVYSEEKQAQLAWLLRVVTLTLKNASEEGNMFAFVPDFYLEAVSDLSFGIRSHVHPTAPIEGIPGYQDMFVDVAEFLCDRFLDPRIVHANSKDTLVLTLAGFVSNLTTLEALENVPKESRKRMVESLLKPYENRAWAQSNWVLVRFWQGKGFAFRYEKSPHLVKKVGPKMLQQESISQPIKPCPSEIYQKHVGEALLGNLQGTTQFLNSLLNQLNWAFSEFIGMLQEIQNISSRPERVFIESRQLKICTTCFDLAITLLRVLEMIATVATRVFNDASQPSSGNLLARLCQLLCQILNRVSSQTGCFQHVVLLDIPDLDSVDHFPILVAVIGILLALLDEEMTTFEPDTRDVSWVTMALLTEPSFQIGSLTFVLGESQKNTKIRNIKPFTLLNYKEDVTDEEIARVRRMINYLELNTTLLPDSKLTSDDENVCPICYAYPIAATFQPCRHQSCRACIDRHLLNSRECFFCKATINKVIDLQGVSLHDFSDDN
ncbi:E3 ubiquitin-protein ligase RNF123 isoform X2 [Orussus abietinus]|uniref:E3 ubiquitin-protein ligase RNF123 isoform X2 n=1 Tax=Orussus abietinus TaxID=222816 RepID=UPI0006269EC7|nr:E3 ubiquitin-protein ligase RNF123 isoform X2 [Orussus abietinus]